MSLLEDAKVPELEGAIDAVREDAALCLKAAGPRVKGHGHEHVLLEGGLEPDRAVVRLDVNLAVSSSPCCLTEQVRHPEAATFATEECPNLRLHDKPFASRQLASLASDAVHEHRGGTPGVRQDMEDVGALDQRRRFRGLLAGSAPSRFAILPNARNRARR